MYGESVYGTTAGPLGGRIWGRCTAGSGKLHLHVFNWPTDGVLRVAGVNNTVLKASLLSGSARESLEFQHGGDGDLTLTVPLEAPDNIDSVIVLEV